MYSYGSPHMAAQKQDDQLERTFSSYVRIQDVVLKTYLGRWTIGRSGERGSGISVLPARYDDDDDIWEREDDSDNQIVIFRCRNRLIWMNAIFHNHHHHHIMEVPWCSRYRCRNWTRRHEFKSWTRLIAFQIALIPLGKVWIQLFSLQLWVNSRTD